MYRNGRQQGRGELGIGRSQYFTSAAILFQIHISRPSHLIAARGVGLVLGIASSISQCTRLQNLTIEGCRLSQDNENHHIPSKAELLCRTCHGVVSQVHQHPQMGAFQAIAFVVFPETSPHIYTQVHFSVFLFCVNVPKPKV